MVSVGNDDLSELPASISGDQVSCMIQCPRPILAGSSYNTLHPQLGYLTQPLQLGRVAVRKTLRAFAFGAVLGNPIAQGARVDTQVPSHLGDRLAGVPDNADRPLPEARDRTSSVSLTYLLLILHASTVSGEVQARLQPAG